MEHRKILFIEHDRLRTYEEGRFGEPSSAELRKLYSGAIIPLSLLSTHTLKLSDRLSEEELRIQVEIRMFEEGNLSSDEEYTIDFIRHAVVSDDSVLVEVFALSHTKAAEYYADVLAKTGAVDVIVPGFLAYAPLFDHLPSNNDLFLYWGDEEAYAAIYLNGVYIAHRSIETLAAIAVDVGQDLPRLKQMLQTQGVIEENYLPQELNKYLLIQEKIAKNIERIVHTINHKRGLFGLSGIDRLHLDFEGKSIPGLESVFHAYGVNDLTVSALTHERTPPEEIHDALCADALLPSRTGAFNLSPYPRKAAWYRRESGKFLALSAAALLTVLLCALGMEWKIASEEERHAELQNRYDTLRKETAALSATLKTGNARLKAQKEASDALREEIALYHGAEDTASLVRQMHAAREKFLADTTAELGRYRLGATLMEQNGSKEMSLVVVADDKKRDTIAKLMSGLFERGYQNVQTHEIKLDNGMYNSLVKVTR